MYNESKTEHAHHDDHSFAHFPHSDIAIATKDFKDRILISLNIEAVK